MASKSYERFGVEFNRSEKLPSGRARGDSCMRPDKLHAPLTTNLASQRLCWEEPAEGVSCAMYARRASISGGSKVKFGIASWPVTIPSARASAKFSSG